MQTQNMKERAIFDLVNSDVRFKKFSDFVKAAELDERLAKAQDLTVFAPTNEAFAGLTQEKTAEMLKPENREQLKKQMLLHVVPRALDIDALSKAATGHVS